MGQSLVRLFSLFLFWEILELKNKKGSSSLCPSSWILQVHCISGRVSLSQEVEQKGNPCEKIIIARHCFAASEMLENVREGLILIHQFDYGLELRFTSGGLSNTKHETKTSFFAVLLWCQSYNRYL